MSDPGDDDVKDVEDNEQRRFGEQLRNRINALGQPRQKVAKPLEVHEDVQGKESIPCTTQVFRFGASTHRANDTNAKNPTTPPSPSPTIVGSSHKKTSIASPNPIADETIFLKTYIPLKSTVIDGITYSAGE
ncbi:hypothetical protein MPER_00116 [Moniliophthora perniciosa FA553]|nr:hypothetical protein MPER_00116 [Moniliophthora perniciosa FA553]